MSSVGRHWRWVVIVQFSSCILHLHMTVVNRENTSSTDFLVVSLNCNEAIGKMGMELSLIMGTGWEMGMKKK